MSDYNQLDGAALDRYITGNYGEDQFKGTIECLRCEGSGKTPVVDFYGPGAKKIGERDCRQCEGTGRVEEPESEDCSCFRYEEDEVDE